VTRLRLSVIVGASLVVALLGVFAYSLAHAQSQARGDVQQRFRDVASVSAALTGGVFESAIGTAQQTAARKLGGPTISQRELTSQATTGMNPYIEVFDAHGKLLGATPGAPGAPPGPSVQHALASGRPGVSDVISGSGTAGVMEYSLPFRSPTGARVEVSGIRVGLLSAFLTSFLAKVPNFAGSTSVILDSHGVILGGPQFLTEVGRPIGDRSLLAALARSNHGDYGSGRYFAAAPISASTWRAVISTSQSRLYSSVNGSRRTIPWLLFGAFALAALMGLYLLRRATVQRAEIERKVLNERHAVEINDNIIQGLVLAHYRLSEGEQATSAAQLANTLREAQRLVSDLLGDDEVEPGSLRRPGAASVSGPPEREPSESERG
jgi:hypothetical protein